MARLTAMQRGNPIPGATLYGEEDIAPGWQDYLREQYGPAPEPIPIPDTAAITNMPTESANGLGVPPAMPTPPPQPAATLEDILSNRLKASQDKALADTSLGLAVANINTDISRAFSPVLETPIDPSAGAGARALAQLPMQRAQQERETLLRQYATDKEREKLSMGQTRANALREYAISKGISIPQGLSEESTMGLLGQEAISKRSAAAIAQNLALAKTAQADANEQRRLDRQNRLDVAMLRRRGGGGAGGAADTYEQAARERFPNDPAKQQMFRKDEVFRRQTLSAESKSEGPLSTNEQNLLNRFSKQADAVLGFVNSINRLDTLVGIDDTSDIPGMGRGAAIPSMGYRLGGALGLIDEKDADRALNIRQEADEIYDLLARLRTGAAINPSEEEHYKSILGKGLKGSDKEFRNAMRRLRELISAKIRNNWAGVTSRITDEYVKRGGVITPEMTALMGNQSTAIGVGAAVPGSPQPSGRGAGTNNAATASPAPIEERIEEDETGKRWRVTEYSDGTITEEEEE